MAALSGAVSGQLCMCKLIFIIHHSPGVGVGHSSVCIASSHGAVGHWINAS